MGFVKENGRTIPVADKVFALSGRAKAAIAAKGKDAVVNATVGALLDDNGDLVVMSSVVEAIRTLTPADYAEYAPITGTPAFKEAVVKALFGNYEPSGHVNLCVTPGGTGSITSVIANYYFSMKRACLTLPISKNSLTSSQRCRIRWLS